jgi:hypothetical protein
MFNISDNYLPLFFQKKIIQIVKKNAKKKTPKKKKKVSTLHAQIGLKIARKYGFQYIS